MFLQAFLKTIKGVDTELTPYFSFVDHYQAPFWKWIYRFEKSRAVFQTEFPSVPVHIGMVLVPKTSVLLIFCSWTKIQSLKFRAALRAKHQTYCYCRAYYIFIAFLGVENIAVDENILWPVKFVSLFVENFGTVTILSHKNAIRTQFFEFWGDGVFSASEFFSGLSKWKILLWTEMCWHGEEQGRWCFESQVDILDRRILKRDLCNESSFYTQRL